MTKPSKPEIEPPHFSLNEKESESEIIYFSKEEINKLYIDGRHSTVWIIQKTIKEESDIDNVSIN